MGECFVPSSRPVAAVGSTGDDSEEQEEESNEHIEGWGVVT